MGEVSIIGLDLAKNVFQAHGVRADGSVLFRRKLSRAQLLNLHRYLPRDGAILVAKVWADVRRRDLQTSRREDAVELLVVAPRRDVRKA